MHVANNFCDLPLSKYLDSKTVLIYCPHPVEKFRLFSRNCCHFRIAYEIKKNIRNIRNFEDTKFREHPIRELIIYSHDGSAFSVGGNMWTDPGTK
jgi:hypothetical protein